VLEMQDSSDFAICCAMMPDRESRTRIDELQERERLFQAVETARGRFASRTFPQIFDKNRSGNLRIRFEKRRSRS